MWRSCDVTRPMTCVSDDGSVRRLSLNLPRRSLVPISDSSRKEGLSGAAEHLPDVYSTKLFSMLSTETAQHARLPTHTCSWQSTT